MAGWQGKDCDINAGQLLHHGVESPPSVFIFKPRADWVIMMIQFPLLCWKLCGNFYDFDATSSTIAHNPSGDICDALFTRGPRYRAGISDCICVGTNTPNKPPTGQ